MNRSLFGGVGRSRLRMFMSGGGILVALILLTPIVVWWAVPSSKLEKLLEQELSRRAGVPIDLGPLEKGVIPVLSSESVTILMDDMLVVAAAPIRVHPAFSRLIRGELSLVFDGNSFGGILEAGVGVYPGPLSVQARVRGAHIGEIAALGDLDAEGITDLVVESTKEGTLRARFGIYDFVPGQKMMQRFPVPVRSFEAIEGDADLVSLNLVKLKSLTADAEGIYATMKGTIKGGRLDLEVQLMPSARWLEEQAILGSMLERYRLGPGVYSVPVKGTLRNPRVG